jgi:CRISPR-associated protein Csx10
MNGFLYTLTLEEPVLAGNLGGDPNSADSRFYIPGSALRGAAIQSYTGNKDAADDDFRRLFLNGATRFLNAYPVIDGKRALPASLAWKTKRKPDPNEPKKIYRDFSMAPIDVETKNIPFEFWQMKAGVLICAEEQWQINVHTQRDAVRGRATTDAGAVYRYIALPAGMKLQGIVLTQNEADAITLKDLLGARILLGKARTAGYGHAKVETAPLPEGWRETGQSLNAARKVTITLLSPAIVRDENGQFSLDILPALSARLGKNVKLGTTQCRVEIISGYNRTWGLPLPQAIAIAAGGVFEVESDASFDDWLKLESTGLGERRAEGFGRLAVNLEMPAEVEWKKVDLELMPLAAGQLTKNDPVAERMLTRLLRRDVDEQIIHCAREAANLYVGGIPNSQLSRWRVIVRDVLETRDLDRLKKFTQESKGRPGWKKMEKWIEDLLEQPEILDKAWEREFNPERKLGDAVVAITPDLNAEYRLRLLDAVLTVLSKKSGGKNGS